MTDSNENKIGFENLPNVYFKRLRTRMTPITNTVIVTGFLTIFEGKEQRYWDDDEYFKSLLRIRIKVYRNHQFSNAIAASGADINTDVLMDEFFIYGPFKGNRPIPFRVEYPDNKVNGLYLSANLEMDLESIPDADFNWTLDEWYRGPTTQEQIFNDSDKVLSMFRYVNGDNVHFGPVHSHKTADGRQILMPGSFHRDPTTGRARGGHGTLEPQEFFNYKNYYIENRFNSIDQVEEINNIMAQAPALYLGAFDSGQQFTKLHAFISDSNLSIKTKIGRRLYELNPEYFYEINNKVEVRSIKIYKEVVESFSSFSIDPYFNPGASNVAAGSSQIYSRAVSFSTWPGPVEQESYYLIERFSPSEREIKSQIKKLEFQFNNDIDVYMIKDYMVSAFKDEFFRYNMRVDFVSKVDEMLKRHMKQMRQYIAELQTTFNVFYNNAQYYNHELEMLTPDGFIALNEEYGFAIEKIGDLSEGLEYKPSLDTTENQVNAYWTKIPQLYSEMIKFLERNPKPREDYLTLFNLLNPISASPETILNAIYRLISLELILRHEYDVSSLPSFENISNVSLPSSSPDIYSLAFQSSEIIEHPAYLTTAPQYDFIGVGPSPLGPETGDGYVRGPDLLNRVDTELAEFVQDLNIIDPSQYPNYSNQQITDLNSTVGSFSFLTPKQAIIQGQNVNLTSLDPNEQDKIKIFKAANTPRLGIKATAPEKSLLDKKNTSVETNDVRQYVGDDSLFALSTPDAFYKKINKIKPEISTTNLNFYSSKGRNFSLENLKKSNLSTKQMPPSIKNIFRSDFKRIDPFQNLQTRDAFFNKFFNVIQISYLSGFETMPDGILLNISKPIYTPISREKLAEVKTYLICKAEPIDVLSSLNSSYEKIEKKNIQNSVFIVKGVNIK